MVDEINNLSQRCSLINVGKLSLIQFALEGDFKRTTLKKVYKEVKKNVGIICDSIVTRFLRNQTLIKKTS